MFTHIWSRAVILFLHLFVFALLATDAHEKLQDEHKELRIKYFQLKQEADDLRDKMRFFTKVQLAILSSSVQRTCLYPLFFRAANMSLSSVLPCSEHVFILFSSMLRTCFKSMPKYDHLSFFSSMYQTRYKSTPKYHHSSPFIHFSSVQRTCYKSTPKYDRLSTFLPCSEHVLNLHQTTTVHPPFFHVANMF